MTLQGFPPSAPFPESVHEPHPGAGADFPASAGGREQGKFRPSRIRLLTQIAVVNDDGTEIGHAVVETNDEIIFWLKAMYQGLILKDMAEDVTDGLVFES